MTPGPAILTLLVKTRSSRSGLRCRRASGYLPHFAPSLGLMMALLLASCSSNPPAPVVDMSTTVESSPADVTARKAASTGATYRVVRGDTLYAIAFRNGVDFRELAAWNGIEPPYRIYAGQDLRLGPPAGEQSSPRAAAVAPAAPARAPEIAAAATPSASPTQNGKPAATGGGMFEDVPATPSEPPRAEATSASAPASHSESADVLAAPPAAAAPPPAKATVTETPVKPAPPPKATEEAAVNNAGGLVWRWPGKGPLIGSFVAGDQTRQGIDIGGTAGDPVLAAADGEVVYSGNGLLGYGELIIVKHNANFLSAYGHNRKRLVKEGDRIKAGEQIAEMGSSASARDEVHFEIRKNGKPVNPIDYLPPR
jgi:lipoprotein NlpD